MLPFLCAILLMGLVFAKFGLNRKNFSASFQDPFPGIECLVVGMAHRADLIGMERTRVGGEWNRSADASRASVPDAGHSEQKGDSAMFRKLLGGLVLLGVGSYLLFGTSVGSYVRTGYVQAVGYCKGQIPVHFKIERARQLVHELHPDIHKAARDIAVEEVRIVRLKDEIARAEKDRDDQQVAILAIRDQLKKGLASYTVGGRQYSQADMERDLARRFKSYKRVAESLEQRSSLLQARESKLVSARDTYQGLMETKKELEAEIEALDAEQKSLEARKVAKRIVIDDGRFQHARKALDDIKEQLSVDQKLIETEGYMVDPVPAEEIAPADLTDQIDQYFDHPAKADSST